ncbi:hypothetical protein NC651_013229 [Populus alba x Populus x berolinensis]|nr:hypothetical protein NC651_013229 [Populus alba x Populus x berolinensis]
MDLNAQAQLSALVVAPSSKETKNLPLFLSGHFDLLLTRRNSPISLDKAKKGLFTELKSCGRVTLILAWFTQITTSKQSVFLLLLLLLLVLCSCDLIEPCQYLSTLSCLSKSISKNTIPLEQLMEKILRVFSSMT